MQIRKNTKAFKTILEIVELLVTTEQDRDKLIRLYITKAGHTIDDRINVAGIQGDSGLFYDMTYQTILQKMTSLVVVMIVRPLFGLYFFQQHR